MYNNSTQSGYTTVVSAPPTQPLTLRDVDNGGPIRSVTVGNQTTATTVTVYIGASAIGAPIYSIAPGNSVTLPVMQCSAVTFAFTNSVGTSWAGTVFIHTDPSALAASGFQVGVAGNSPPAAQMYTVRTTAINITSSGLQGIIIPIPSLGRATYIYSYSVSAFVTAPSSIVKLSVYADIAYSFGWIIFSQASNSVPLNMTLSGGPLPIQVFPAGYQTYIRTDLITGTMGIDYDISLTYAVF